jgi:hypothetical protein
MPYYETLAEDVARAKQILAEGRWSADDPFYQILQRHITSGTIFGKDIYAAYKLLESFVAAIEAVGPKVCELALRHQQLTREEPEP